MLALSDQKRRGSCASQSLVASGITLANTMAMLMLLARKPTAPAPRSASSRMASLPVFNDVPSCPAGWGCSRRTPSRWRSRRASSARGGSRSCWRSRSRRPSRPPVVAWSPFVPLIWLARALAATDAIPACRCRHPHGAELEGEPAGDVDEVGDRQDDPGRGESQQRRVERDADARAGGGVAAAGGDQEARRRPGKEAAQSTVAIEVGEPVTAPPRLQLDPDAGERQDELARQPDRGQGDQVGAERDEGRQQVRPDERGADRRGEHEAEGEAAGQQADGVRVEVLGGQREVVAGSRPPGCSRRRCSRRRGRGGAC